MNSINDTDRARLVSIYGADAIALVADLYPAALPMLADGCTLDGALNHVQGMCDRELCTADHEDVTA